MRTRIVAVDDELLALKGLSHLLREIDGVSLVATATGIVEARRAIQRYKPDLVLLDIRMRDGSGLDLATELANNDGPAIVFVTAFDRYATRAFELAAADYVLKPAEPERLARAIARAREQQAQHRTTCQIEELKAIITSLREQEMVDRESADQAGEIWVRRNATDVVRLRPQDIEAVEAEGDYVRIFSGGRSFLHRSSIHAMERGLGGGDFIRIHRSALVRFDLIAEVHRTRFGLQEVTLRDGRRVKVGRVHAKTLRQRLTGMSQAR